MTVGPYTNMGPSLSRHIMMPFGLTDRGTGTVYYLTAASTAIPRLALDTTHALPGAIHPNIYAVGDEPFYPLPNGTIIRIFVRDGRLGFEEVNIHIHSNHRLIATQIANWREVRYEFVLPAGFFVSVLNAPGSLDNPAFETDPDFGRLL